MLEEEEEEEKNKRISPVLLFTFTKQSQWPIEIYIFIRKFHMHILRLIEYLQKKKNQSVSWCDLKNIVVI